MRTRRVALTATAVAVVVALQAGLFTATASAEPPAPVSIEATVTQFFPTFSGVWQASGAIEDSGTFVRTDLNPTGSLQNSPVVGALQVRILFSGAKGSFTVGEELLGTATSLTGNWQIASATGGYSGARGHGTSEFVFPTIYFTGELSL